MTGPFVLWGEPGSGSFMVEAVLAMAGADVELVDISLQAHAQRGSDYLALNPAGRIPALRLPEGVLLTESVAILLHLAERFPALALLPPAASVERAKTLRAMLFAATELYPAVTRSDYPERLTADGRDVEVLREQAGMDLHERLRVAERELVTGPWVLGEVFSLADIYLACLSRWVGDATWRSRQTPKVEAVAAAVAALPKVAPVWRRHFARDA